MPRPPSTPATALGVAMQRRREATPLRDVAQVVGVADNTLSRLERGTHRPSADTAVKLARWLGWSVEEVLSAAVQPAPPIE